MNDGLVVVDFLQDADSFGWRIVALFHVLDKRRWGVLDALAGTDVGADDERTSADVVHDLWYCVDWYEDNETKAREAFVEARSRVW